MSNIILLVPRHRPDLVFCVPYSELAMHMRIAGRHITYAHVKDRIAVIEVDGHTVKYDGLISELLPFELRIVLAAVLSDRMEAH